MRVLGIDPGATTGWCLYVHSDAGAYVESAGTFEQWHGVPSLKLLRTDYAVIERPKGYGPTRPELVDCGYVCGRIVGEMGRQIPYMDLYELTRIEVCKTLTEATHGAVRVRNNATAWAALVLLHGEDSDRKPKRKKGVVIDQGGPLGEVSSHARAALAVAVAFALRTEALRAAAVAP